MHGSNPVSIVGPNANGSYVVELRGFFAPDWTGIFCAALGAHKVNVERGFAKQVQAGSWESRFTVRAADRATDLSKLDYRELASGKTATELVPRGRPRIRSFSVQDCDDGIVVSLIAADGLGLLGSILGVFSMLMLYVHDMQIETAHGEARDTFLLKGFAGIRPTAALRTRLKSSLQMHCEGARA